MTIKFCIRYSYKHEVTNQLKKSKRLSMHHFILLISLLIIIPKPGIAIDDISDHQQFPNAYAIGNTSRTVPKCDCPISVNLRDLLKEQKEAILEEKDFIFTYEGKTWKSEVSELHPRLNFEEMNKYSFEFYYNENLTWFLVDISKEETLQGISGRPLNCTTKMLSLKFYLQRQ